jgi:hypothetical protein
MEGKRKMPTKISFTVVVMTTIRGGCKQLHFLPSNHSSVSCSNFSPHLTFPRGYLPLFVFRNNQRRKEKIEGRGRNVSIAGRRRWIVTWCGGSHTFTETYFG